MERFVIIVKGREAVNYYHKALHLGCCSSPRSASGIWRTSRYYKDIIRWRGRWPFAVFQDTYIGRYRRNAPSRAPLFAINLWNIFNRTDDELPRRNNSVEGWHRSFQDHVSACHPVFWKFLSVLQKEENMIRISIVQQLAGHLAPPPRQLYLDSSRRILNILDDNPNQQRLQYLRAIAHNLTF